MLQAFLSGLQALEVVVRILEFETSVSGVSLLSDVNEMHFCLKMCLINIFLFFCYL